MAQAQQPLTSATQPTDVYGGDEVSALVLDPGFCHTRAGFAGEDVPKVVVPSYYAHFAAKEGTPARDLFGDEVLIPRAELEIRNYMNRDSVVEDWDTAVKLWEHMLIRRLQPMRTPAVTAGTTAPTSHAAKHAEAGDEMDVDAEAELAEAQEKPLAENPLLMTEAPWNAGKARERAIEVAMESWGTPAFWLSRTPVLAAFAAGKASALVIDVGGAGTNVTAVHDGMVLRRSVQRSPVGGLYLSHQIRAMLPNPAGGPKKEKAGGEAAAAVAAVVELLPAFLIENKTAVDAGAPAQARLRRFPFAVQASFRAYEEERLLTEFKESVVEVWKEAGRFTAPGNEEAVRAQLGRVFEMPDGSNQMWREQRYRVAEGMWDAAAAYATEEEEAAGGPGIFSSGAMAPITRAQTIPELVRAAVNGVDVDLRPLLLGNVVVTGSTSLLNGFNDRLNRELVNTWPGVKVKIHAAGLTSERRFGAWIGGSILASLGTFHQMWISRAEYEENGAAIVEKRCK